MGGIDKCHKISSMIQVLGIVIGMLIRSWWLPLSKHDHIEQFEDMLLSLIT